ncbi:hypothetical protein [Morganella psychrotolerans]|uniref:Uncharacterized protein n=1 Tax=Morganella psychrotolerans TaxID=368603 RepID=A0A1B8HDG6_9GAMM|nr:hypothetical protein [Morganella psychrotolerans]OBU07056.1 hypothetical protein AYY17_19340 [Morganella psychrotolerans]
MDVYFGRNEAEEEYIRKLKADDLYKKLEAQLAEMDDDNIHALLTVEEASQFVSIMQEPTSYKQESGKDIFFKYAGIVTSFTGNYLDAYGLGKLINEIKSFGVEAIEYVGKDGNRYIKLTGLAGLRTYLNATRYLVDNPKMLEFGIGEVGFETNLVKGARFCVLFSAGYRVLELLFKDEYGLTDFFVNLSMDAAKTLISTGVLWALSGTVTTAVTFLFGGGIIAVSIVLFGVGLGVAIVLFIADDYFKISEGIISALKNNIAASKAQDLRNDINGGFHIWAGLSRG